MNWLEILNTIFFFVLIPLVLTLGGYLISLVSAKKNELKAKTDNTIAHKYLDMLEDTITKSVVATTQTYVESLKGKNAFDKVAQAEAFNKTYNAIISTLTDEASSYITSIVGDLRTYITTRIEYNVNMQK